MKTKHITQPLFVLFFNIATHPIYKDISESGGPSIRQNGSKAGQGTNKDQHPSIEYGSNQMNVCFIVRISVVDFLAQCARISLSRY